MRTRTGIRRWYAAFFKGLRDHARRKGLDAETIAKRCGFTVRCARRWLSDRPPLGGVFAGRSLGFAYKGLGMTTAELDAIYRRARAARRAS